MFHYLALRFRFHATPRQAPPCPAQPRLARPRPAAPRRAAPATPSQGRPRRAAPGQAHPLGGSAACLNLRFALDLPANLVETGSEGRGGAPKPGLLEIAVEALDVPPGPLPFLQQRGLPLG